MRTKVELIRASQCLSQHPARSPEFEAALESAQAHLSLASRYALGVNGPLVIAPIGFTGCGKSTIAEDLATLTYGQLHTSDILRKEIFTPEGEQISSVAPFNSQLYTSDKMNAVYQALLERVDRSIQQGNPTVADASFLKREHRQMLADLCEKRGVPLLFVLCTASPELTKARLDQRLRGANKTLSDGRWEIYEAQKRAWQGIAPDEAINLIELETTSTPRELALTILSKITNKST